MIVSIIVAMDERGGIGVKNQLPWHLPSDLKRFKKLTMGHHLIVGRKTYASIGKPLPGRTMVVISRNQEFQAAGCLMATSLAEALQIVEQRGEQEVFIGGGGQVFTQALGIADRIYLTRVHTVIAAEVYFPAWDMSVWRVNYHQDQAQAKDESPAYSFWVLERSGRVDYPGIIS